MPAERSSDDSTPSGWTALENRLYRRDVNYSSLPWSLRSEELSHAITSVAPCGGPIALVPDAGWGLSFALAIYSLSGRLIERFDRLREKTVPPFRAVALGWSRDDVLTVVYNDGAVVRVPAGTRLDRSRLVKVFDQNKDDRIYDAVVVDDGEVVLRGATGAVYRLSPEDKVRQEAIIVRPPEGVVREVPNGGIAAVQPRHSVHGAVETLFVTESGKIALINSTGTFTMRGERDVSQICVSPNGQYVAAIESTTGNLFVSTVDLNTEITHINLVVELSMLGVENVLSDVIFDARMQDSISWVGSDAIAALYKEHLVLIGPHGGVAVLTLGYASPQGGFVLHSEIDGLRLISASKVEFVQMVAEPVHAVRCRKQAAGYKLLKSSGEISCSTETPSDEALKRYRLLRELRDSGSLLEASRSCTAAAYLEVDVEQQKRLLHAAAYGQKHATVFSESADAKASPTCVPASSGGSGDKNKRSEDRSRRDINMVPTAIAILRVLYAAGTPEAGVPLSKPQLDTLGLSALVARLARYGQHTLAIRLAFFGGISPYDVLSEWATDAVRVNIEESDDVITSVISERFEAVSRSYTGIDMHGSRRGRALPYVRAAEAAYALGRQKCAELLLRRESRPAPKVAMYLKMNREAPAMISAVASGDPELALDALRSILKTKSMRETAKLLRTLPPAVSNRATDLFASHLKQIGDFNLLRMVYMEVGRRREAALVEIFLADQIADHRERMAALEKTALTISRGYSRRACHFEVQAVQHAAVVASSAIDLEKRSRLSPGELRSCNDGDLLDKAVSDITDVNRRRDTLAKLRKELRIPDRRFFWIVLDSMARVGDFESIEALSKSAGHGRAPPIGLSPFVDVCIKYRMDDEAVKYALRITDLRDRARALARCGRGREAADIASRLRNQQLLEEVQDLAARHVAYLTIPSARTTNNGRSE